MTITNEIENERILERIESLFDKDDLADYEIEELNELVCDVVEYEDRVYPMGDE